MIMRLMDMNAELADVLNARGHVAAVVAGETPSLAALRSLNSDSNPLASQSTAAATAAAGAPKKANLADAFASFLESDEEDGAGEDPARAFFSQRAALSSANASVHSNAVASSRGASDGEGGPRGGGREGAGMGQGLPSRAGAGMRGDA